ncbi:MAG: Amuc_1102 family pilus-like protein, partial [Rubritalea sp.]|uniref:Amuc_1102 family pilus-like protein n=1 Tax=Rubritalea sp. TaxID=2109375 RepID=UPI003241CBF0
MKKSKLKRLFSMAALVALSVTGSLYAQAGKVKVSDPKFDDLKSPKVGGNTISKSWDAKDWLEAEVKFKVEMPRTYKQKFVDSVTVKWYVAIKNPAGSGYALIEKEVEHVNVPVGEEVYSV